MPVKHLEISIFFGGGDTWKYLENIFSLEKELMANDKIYFFRQYAKKLIPNHKIDFFEQCAEVAYCKVVLCLFTFNLGTYNRRPSIVP